MDVWQSIRSELPHYIAVLALAYLALLTANRVYPEIVLWQEILVALAIAIAYIVAVTRLGYAPASWYPGRDVG